MIGTGMDLLEPHMKSGLGVSFKADNGKFLTVIGRSSGQRNIEAAKQYKDNWTKFTIQPIDKSYVYLKAYDGKYLSLIYRGGKNNIEAAKSSPDSFCRFRVYQSAGKVVLQANNNAFLSRIHRGNQQNIEAAKYGIDEPSKFIVETGSRFRVTEEIESISWGTFNPPAALSPTVIGTHVQKNGGSKNIVKKFTFEKTMESSQTTNWEHSWGLSTGISYTAEAGVNVGVASGKTSLTLSAEVRYDGKKGGNEGKKKILKFSDETTVIIPPQKWVTVKFMVKKVDNAEVPFTATIRRKSEVGESIIKEEGVWRGIMVLDSYIDVIERPLNQYKL